MKKYRLLIDSPHIPKGTIVEFDAKKCDYFLVLNGIINFSPAQIEKRPEVWEEIVEQEKVQAEEQNKYLPFQPKEGEEYWYINTAGEIYEATKRDLSKRINVFRTEKAAEYEKLRQQSVSNRWKPKNNEAYFMYDFEAKNFRNYTYQDSPVHQYLYIIGNIHKTKEEALQWGKMYSEAWKVLL